MAAQSDAAGFVITTSPDKLSCDTLIDARGLRSLRVGSLFFSVLRSQIGEGENASDGAPVEALAYAKLPRCRQQSIPQHPRFLNTHHTRPAVMRLGKQTTRMVWRWLHSKLAARALRLDCRIHHHRIVEGRITH